MINNTVKPEKKDHNVKTFATALPNAAGDSRGCQNDARPRSGALIVNFQYISHLALLFLLLTLSR